MIRIELVEDGLPASVLYGYVDAIEEAMLREREAFEWALAREAMSPFSGFQSRLMARLRARASNGDRSSAPRWPSPAPRAWATGSGHHQQPPPRTRSPRMRGAPSVCPICMDRAVSAHKGAAFEVTFAAELCCVCGATTCSVRRGRHATRGGRGPRPDVCHVPDALMVTGAARHLRLRHLVEKRPTGPHVAQALYELGSMRARGDGCVGDATKAFKHLADAAKRGHARAALALAACFAEGKGCARNPARRGTGS